MYEKQNKTKQRQKPSWETLIDWLNLFNKNNCIEIYNIKEHIKILQKKSTISCKYQDNQRKS